MQIQDVPASRTGSISAANGESAVNIRDVPTEDARLQNTTGITADLPGTTFGTISITRTGSQSDGHDVVGAVDLYDESYVQPQPLRATAAFNNVLPVHRDIYNTVPFSGDYRQTHFYTPPESRFIGQNVDGTTTLSSFAPSSMHHTYSQPNWPQNNLGNLESYQGVPTTNVSNNYNIYARAPSRAMAQSTIDASRDRTASTGEPLLPMKAVTLLRRNIFHKDYILTVIVGINIMTRQE